MSSTDVAVAGPARAARAREPWVVPMLYLRSGPRERVAVRDRLGRLGTLLTVAADLPGAAALLRSERFAVCLLDLADERTAIASVRVLHAQFPALPLAGVVDPAHPQVAGEAVLAGVADLLPWPFDERDVATMISNISDRALADPGGGVAGPAPMMVFAHSGPMRTVMELVNQAAVDRGGVCITGEPGTGRELVARAIHGLEGESDERPFVMVTCSGRAPADLETSLFGNVSDRREHTRTGTTERIADGSAVARARGGTLFLTNLAEAPSRVQIRLARLLRDHEGVIAETGALADLDIRPIAAVAADIDACLADGRVRRDLFERFARLRIDVPPLRRRREDIPLLAVHALRQICERQGVAPKGFSRAALALLTALPWQGNAVELMALLEALVRLVRRSVIQIDDLLQHTTLEGMSTRIDTGGTLREARARFERECISAALRRHHGRVGEAARSLGIQRTNLYRKVRQLKIERSLLSARR